MKRLSIKVGKIKLMPENHSYEPIEARKGMDFKTQGVVVWVIRKTGVSDHSFFGFVKAQTSAPTQPKNVHPNKMFNTIIAHLSLCLRS